MVALSIAVVVLWVFVIRSAWRAWQPARLLRIGRYADARSAAEHLSRSWMRVFPSVRVSSRFVIGCALHLEGDLEAAISTLAPLHNGGGSEAKRVGADMRRAICGIEAACLVLGDRDFVRADALAMQAIGRKRTPEDILLEALTKQGIGDSHRAAHLFEQAEAEANAIGSVDVEMFHALRGLWFTKLGRWTEAERNFEIAAKHPLPNVYVMLARAMLDRAATEVRSEGPSSLAPQVVATDPRET